MKNSELFWTILLGMVAIILFTGLLIVKPVVMFVILGIVLAFYLFVCLVEQGRGDNWTIFPYKWNIFNRINDFLNSFPQLIKNEKHKS